MLAPWWRTASPPGRRRNVVAIGCWFAGTVLAKLLMQHVWLKTRLAIWRMIAVVLRSSVRCAPRVGRLKQASKFSSCRWPWVVSQQASSAPV